MNHGAARPVQVRKLSWLWEVASGLVGSGVWLVTDAWLLCTAL